MIDPLEIVVEKKYCKICDTKTDQVFNGPQYLDEIKIYNLYTCTECNHTKAYDFTAFYLMKKYGDKK